MRTAHIHRKTNETDIYVELNLDGKGDAQISTSIAFLDHMLTLFAFHSQIDLKIKAKGDTEVDYHHLIEDIGITLGQALHSALADKKGINRYGFFLLPMDETLAETTIDISGRAYLVYNVKLLSLSHRDFEFSLFEDFFRAMTSHAMITLHINVRYGRDSHHIFEAIFKSFARALRQAISVDTNNSLPSTKGLL